MVDCGDDWCVVLMVVRFYSYSNVSFSISPLPPHPPSLHFFFILLSLLQHPPTHASSSCFIFTNSSFGILPSNSPRTCNFSREVSKSGFGGAGGILNK